MMVGLQLKSHKGGEGRTNDEYFMQEGDFARGVRGVLFNIMNMLTIKAWLHKFPSQLIMWHPI